MDSPSGAAGSVRAQIAETLSVKEYVVYRDGERPLSFAGVCLADASTQSFSHYVVSAAVYRTAGGKHIATFSRKSELAKVSSLREAAYGQAPPDERPDGSRLNKAAVFDTVEQAAEWFRPGRLTDEIRKQLGLDDPIRIE
jgi:hypothetical protein